MNETDSPLFNQFDERKKNKERQKVQINNIRNETGDIITKKILKYYEKKQETIMSKFFFLTKSISFLKNTRPLKKKQINLNRPLSIRKK